MDGPPEDDVEKQLHAANNYESFPALRRKTGNILPLISYEEEGTRIIGFNEEKKFSILNLDGVIEEYANYVAQKKYFWLDFQNPQASDIQVFAKLFGIHPLTQEDILEESREKNELFDNYRCVIIKEARGEPRECIDIVILIFSTYALSFHMQPIKGLEEVIAFIQSTIGGFPKPDWIMYSFFNAVVDMFINFVDQIMSEAESLEELVLILTSEEQNDVLRRLGVARRKLSDIRTILWAKKEVLNQLTEKTIPFVSERTSVYLRDVLDQVVLLLQKLDSTTETLNHLNNTYLARVSIEVAEASIRMNNVMKKFGAIATIMLPLTLVAGLFGMNVTIPGQQASIDWFIGIVVGMFVFAVIMSIFFRRIGWL